LWLALLHGRLLVVAEALKTLRLIMVVVVLVVVVLLAQDLEIMAFLRKHHNLVQQVMEILAAVRLEARIALALVVVLVRQVKLVM
jgi:NADH:ubiquinone oxidoreductase subunit K